MHESMALKIPWPVLKPFETSEKNSTSNTTTSTTTCLLPCRSCYLYVPPSYVPGVPSPLLVMLHGAGGHGKSTLATFGELDIFDKDRCLMLVPESRGRTWDMIRWEAGVAIAILPISVSKCMSTFVHMVCILQCDSSGRIACCTDVKRRIGCVCLGW